MTALAVEHPTIQTHDGSASWRALGTYVQLRTAPELIRAATARAVEILDEVDRACSRFRADSDLMAVERTPGWHTDVSPVLLAAVRVALEAARETDGLVDPMLGGVLAAAGYDRTFAQVPAESHSPTTLPVPCARSRWSEVVVTPEALWTPGPGLDLGATGKAFAADLVALTLHDELGGPVVISVGGDVRVVGAPDRQAYSILLAHTHADASDSITLGTVRLADGGLATSSVAARTWRRDGTQWHHVLDPRSGRPTGGPWITVTVAAHTAVAANTASTAALVLGDRAVGWLAERGVAARLVAADGSTARTRQWELDHLDVAS